MARLRDPLKGCPWDVEQTFATIAPYTLEEAYEVVDAIDRGEPTQLRDELGDLLFQVVFHSRLAQEQGWFDFAAVATAIHSKLVRRHPHVFGVEDRGDGYTAETQTRTWEELKARERAELAQARPAADSSALANIPKALPALARAAKIGRRAARVGFDWQEPAQVRAKVVEELQEVDAALSSSAATNAPQVAEEIGDLLFALANWSLHLKINPEEALRAANAKFERRFRHMEAQAAARGAQLEALSPAQWDALWNEAKRAGSG
jgi:ATP diphosphatase